MSQKRQEEDQRPWAGRSTPLPALRSARRNKALSQRELAESAGVSPNTVGLLEAGRRGAYPSTLRKLAAALGVAPAALALRPGDRPRG